MKEPSADNVTLANDTHDLLPSQDLTGTIGAMSQLESFPPLFVTRSNILDSPSLGVVEPMDPPLVEEQGHRRWLILSLSCLLLFGNYFAYDNPAALNTQLQKYLDMPYNEYQYLLSTLYSIYSLPNTILPFLFGHLVDRFGPQRVLLGLSTCVCLGQTLFSIGVQHRQIWMMLLGRAIFGVGGESCGVAQASITTMHFRGHELAFALGLNLCIARFGSVVNAIITPWAEQKWGVPTAIWIGTLSCVASFLSAVILVTLISPPSSTTTSFGSKQDSESSPLLAVTPDVSAADTENHTLYLTSSVDSAGQAQSPSLIPGTPTQPAILHHLPGLLRREASFTDSIHSVRFAPGYAKSGLPPTLHITTEEEKRRDGQGTWWSHWWSDLQYFPLTFWLICCLTVLLYGTVVPFNNIASDFLQSKWYPGNPRKAAAVMGIPDTIGAILVPGFGLIVDKYGGRASTLIVSAFIMVVVHSTLGFTLLNPIFAFSLLGIAYSMYGVALWPSIACVVTNELHLGKGYGISSSFLNISLTLVPPIVATIRVWGDSFLPVEVFFIGMGVCGIVVGFALKVIDHRDGGSLEYPEIQVEVPVIVPATTPSALSSAVASPALSQGRMKFTRRKQRPLLSALQGSGSRWNVRQWNDQREDGSDSRMMRSKKLGQQEDLNDPWDEPQGHSAVQSPNSPSSMSERQGRDARWLGRPLLHRTLTRVGSPLLQRYSSSVHYGSFSSPSIVSMMADGRWDVEDGARPPGGPVAEGYSVSQHPILYNPLRGSTGSFRVSRNARPVSFGDGEEGRIFLNGEMVPHNERGEDDVEDETDYDLNESSFEEGQEEELDRDDGRAVDGQTPTDNPINKDVGARTGEVGNEQ